MMQAPPDVIEAAERRCRAVRDDKLLPYGPLIRAGAHELVSMMFPRFVKRRGHDALVRDIDTFFREFGAGRAEYIQMGTEFVRFMLPRLPGGTERVLLEYEWMLFDVEIDEAMVPEVRDDRLPVSCRINPTVRWLAAPFDLLSDAEPDDALPPGHSRYAYAIYRSADDRVSTHPLGARDIAELAHFEAGTHHASPTDDTSWLVDALQRGLIVDSTAT